MRIIRFADGASARAGVVVDGQVHELRGGWQSAAPGRRLAALDEVRLLSPCRPATIVCAGANYRSQLAETCRPAPKQPMIFLKGANSLAGPCDDILHPPELGRLEYEGELAVVIGRTACSINAADFRDYVWGYTCANDVTAHDWRADGQWTRAKSLDTFCPLGPWIETGLDPESLRIRTRLNSVTVQDCPTSDMVFGVGELLAWVTRWITLQPGDVLLTASPSGIGPMRPGDTVEVEVSGIGVLRNMVTWATPDLRAVPPDGVGGTRPSPG